MAAVNENNALAGQLLALIKSKASDDDMQVLADALPPPPAAALDYLPENFFDGNDAALAEYEEYGEEDAPPRLVI